MRFQIYLVMTILYFAGSSAYSQATGLADWDIYLDPGHSRTENQGIYNYSEAEKNLRVGLHLRELLLTNTDIDTVFNSRFNDNVQVSLSQRTDQANSLGASWFHSIHSDAGSPNLNSTLMLWGQYRDGREKNPPGGQAMGNIMIDILTRTMRTNTRGSIGDCSFYGCTFNGPYLHVNRESNMPSELSEAGFHTSPLQNTRNMNEEWKRLEAYAFFWSILKFHNIERPPVGIVTGFISDLERDKLLNGANISIGGQSYTTDTWESLFHRYSNDPDLLQNGFYFIEDLPNDTLEMIVSAEGFHSDTLNVAVRDTFFTFVDVALIDARPPFVDSTIPADSSEEIAVLDHIEIQFSRRMNAATIDSALSIMPAVEYSLSWLSSNRRLRIIPDTLAFETEYSITITPQAEDLFEHPLDGNKDGESGGDFTFSFKTEPQDLSPPEILAAYPPAGAVDIDETPVINIEFDELVDPASVSNNSILLENPDGNYLPGVLKQYTVGERSVLSFFPDAPLVLETRFVATLQPGIKDIFGNTIDTPQSSDFTTGNFRYDITSIDDFESGILTNWWVPQQSGTTTGIITDETSRGNNSQFINLGTGSSRSMRLSYGWDINANSWLIREYLATGAPRNVHFDDSYILQMYVFGDGSGNKFRFAVDDNVPASGAGNHEVSIWYTIDWVGWRLVSWDLTNDPPGDWIGDGSLDGTLRFDSIQLTHEPGAAETGRLYFDDLRVVRSVIVGIEDTDMPNAVPQQYTLSQNFPNPFNPETSIQYTVPLKTQPVKLVVYDMLGRHIKTLANENKSPGTHAVRWDATNEQGITVGSGLYFYRIQIGEFSQVRKMMFVR